MVSVLLVSLVAYGFYEFVWVPAKSSEADLLTEQQKLESDLKQKNVPLLEKKLQNLKKEKDNFNLKIAEIKEKRTFGTVDYQKLIEYLGKEADTLEVDMTRFKKMEFRNQKVYWEIPYEVVVQGKYENLILFVNSLYKLENYFFITGIELQEVARIPMTEKTIEGSNNLRNDIEFDWAKDFMDKLDRNIPPELRQDMQEEFMKEFADEMRKFEDELQDITNEEAMIHDKLQLRFVFHFIELDEPKN